jgi:hypothetical protein
VPRPHRPGGLAEPVSKFQDHQLENDRFGDLEQRSHRQDRSGQLAVVSHGLRRDQRDRIGPVDRRSLSLSRDEGDPRTGRSGDIHQHLAGRQVAATGRDDEQVAGADRRRGHVPNHVRIDAKVKEPHGEALQRQPFAAGAVKGDASRREDFADQVVSRGVAQPRGDAGKFGDGGVGETAERAFVHRLTLAPKVRTVILTVSPHSLKRYFLRSANPVSR